jgi:hypothetical protein
MRADVHPELVFRASARPFQLLVAYMDRESLVAAITTFLANQEHLDEIRGSGRDRPRAGGARGIPHS